MQTLSPVEKRFLQNHLGPQSSKAKLLLAAFAEETEPSEAVLRDVYAQKGYRAEYLAADRYQLYEAVLEGLALLRNNSISELKIGRILQKARILFDKAQIQAALDYARTGIAKAWIFGDNWARCAPQRP